MPAPRAKSATQFVVSASGQAERRLSARVYDRQAVQGMLPVTLLRVLADYLSSQGVPPGEIIPSRFDLKGGQPLGRVPAEDYCQLLIQSAERLNDPLLGLHLGQTIRPMHLGALGYVLMACDNLGAALVRIQRYHRLLHDINPIEHAVVGDCLEMRWGVAHGRPGALFDEGGIAGIVQFGRDLCGKHVPLAAVDFVNPPPPDIRPYARYFGCPVRFGQPITRLAMPLSSLAMPLRQADPSLLQLMEAQVDSAMAQLPQAGDLAEMARRVIGHLAPSGIPELEQVAQELRLSPRVFYRRLAEQGLNFRELRESALRQLAEMHLKDTRLTLADVTALMGYAEQSAFSRAFKRWTGVPPLQWRQQHVSSA